MTLASLAVNLGVVVGAMTVVAVLTIVGRGRLADLRQEYRARLRATSPYLALLGGVLLVNYATRHLVPDVSWILGWNLTGVIYAIEGTVVASLQSVASGPLTAYFSFMYVYGYVFVIVFPLVAYLALEDGRFLREMCVAYAFNYAIGLLGYVVFISYGPRNLIPDLVDPLLYTHWPQAKFLTSQVNSNTNVFPSLHSSIATTVAFLAYRTRETYPAWTVVAAFFAVSIVISTMYLGIHWFLDVVAGVGLAGAAVLFAAKLVDPGTVR